MRAINTQSDRAVYMELRMASERLSCQVIGNGDPEGFSWRKEEMQSGVERHLGTHPMIADLNGDDD